MAKRKYGQMTHGSRRVVRDCGGKVGGKKKRRLVVDDCYGFTEDMDSSDGMGSKNLCMDSDCDERSVSGDSSQGGTESSRTMSSETDPRRRHGKIRYEGKGKEKWKEESRRNKSRYNTKERDQEIESSRGSVVKRRNEVVITQAKYCARPPNVICRVDMFQSRVISCLDPSRVTEVKGMGFGGLLELKLTHLPRQICYWIMSRTSSSGVIEFGDGQQLMLAPIQLKCILGLPMEEREVPVKACKDDLVMMQRMDAIRRDYRSGGSDGDALSIEKAISVVTMVEVDGNGEAIPLRTSEEKIQFRTAFLIVVLGALLCPLSKWGVLAKDLVAAVTVARNAEKYDWCTFVYNWLLECVGAFEDKFEQKGYVPGCGGCAVFLLLFYLDHLRRPPVRWGVLPRVKVWTQDLMKKAIKEDKQRSGDDYGKLKSVRVAYGEEGHPCGVKDSSRTLVEKVAEEVVRILTPEMERMVSAAVRQHVGSDLNANASLRCGSPSLVGQNVDQTSGRKSACDVFVTDDVETDEDEDLLDKQDGIMSMSSIGNELLRNVQSINRNCRIIDAIQKDGVPILEEVGLSRVLEVQEQPAVTEGQSIDAQPAAEQEASPVSVPAEEQGIKDGAGHRLREVGPVQSEPVPSGETEEGGVDGHPSLSGKSSSDGGRQRTKEKRPRKPNAAIVSPVYEQQTASFRQSQLDKRFLNFVRRWRVLKNRGEGPVLLECNGLNAFQRDCYGVLLPKEFVSNEYIRMASKLYTKRWEVEEFPGKSRRILLSPDFSTRVLATPPKQRSSVVMQYRHQIANVPMNELRVLFLPVLTDEHWWCVAYDLNAKTIWFIDSVYPNPKEVHEGDIVKLTNAVDEMINSLHSKWKVGHMVEWSHRTIDITQPDPRSCGVMMLSCIKSCADRFQDKWKLPERIEIARMRLLLDDAMSDCNEIKKAYDNILPPTDPKCKPNDKVNLKIQDNEKMVPHTSPGESVGVVTRGAATR